MHKLYILLLASLLLSTSVSLASNTIDSIGVENNKGKKVIIYKVEPKETYYSIAKKYNVPYKDVMEFNDSKFLQIGVTLKIPTAIPFTVTSSTIATPEADFIEYTIKAKDNLNMLANKYGTTVDEIKKANQLNSINLQIGQVLKIPTNKEQTLTSEISSASVYKAPESEADHSTATIISHTIKAKESLNALAEKYGTTVEAIKKLNKLRSSSLQIGQVLKIANVNGETGEAAQETVAQPIVNTKAIVNSPTSNSTKNDGSFEHVVATGETIYSIAKKYNLTTYQLTTSNNLSSNELTTGQKLIIKNANKTTGVEEEARSENAETTKDPKLKQPGKFGLVQFNEKGVAVWIEDQDLDPSKMLVLHRTAPVGTIIKVTNPMTNRSTYAKVVGKFTENETTKDVIIVMTKAVADAVGALDKRFNCNLNYGAVENEQQ
ncbi:LysM peptidoglycan-binding domain-containing protein [Pedobacter sp. Du54]|uniref:LysM peptidoglycan-binding domain-containing protein n=1 Tax=Pedobacter anseongensis TaxID=3133439 RepID=UPI0030B6EE1B